jgi:o-succinylbenzoate synthase
VRTLIEADDAPAFAVPIDHGDGPTSMHRGLLIEGAQGWGEFSPPPDADAALLARCFTAATEAGTIGWPDMMRGRIPVAVRVGPVTPEQAHRIVLASGCQAADVTVGTGADHADAERLAAVRAALGSAGAVRCDAGGAWDAETAAAVLPRLASAAGGLQFVANPCRTLPDTAAARRAVDVPIATGAAFAEAADILLLETAAMGGVRRALRFAERTGLPCVVTAPTETSIGLSAGVALAGALPQLPFACALTLRVAADLVTEARSLTPVDGHLPVAPMPPRPDPAQLAAYRLTDAEPVARWRDRLRSAMSF